MIVSQQDIELINNPKIRRREIMLPVRHGKRWGEKKKCPVKEGSICRLEARPPHGRYRAQAELEPTRARSVLMLIDLYMAPVKTTTITVLTVAQVGDEWRVRFEKGEHPELFDTNLYLCRDNDFTAVASRQTVRGDAPYLAPLAKDLERARAKAADKRTEPVRSNMAVLRAAHRRLALRRHTMTVEQRRDHERLGKAIEKCAVSLGGSVADGGTVGSSDCAQDVEARVSDADTKSSTRSVLRPVAA